MWLHSCYTHTANTNRLWFIPLDGGAAPGGGAGGPAAGTCSNSVMANFWCGMQCWAVQMSSRLSALMWKWMRIRRFSWTAAQQQHVSSGPSAAEQTAWACARTCASHASSPPRLLLLIWAWERRLYFIRFPDRTHLRAIHQTGASCTHIGRVRTHTLLLWRQKRGRKREQQESDVWKG